MILLRSRQAAKKPSPEHSPVESREASVAKSQTSSLPPQDRDSLSLLPSRERKSKTPGSITENKSRTPLSEKGSEKDFEVFEEKEAPLHETGNPLEKYDFKSELWR